jgi:quercetin dioxygenase-like cupin family protein
MELSIKEEIFTDRLENNATVILPGEGDRITAGAGSCTFKVTSKMSNNMLGVYEIVVPPNTMGARLHYHRFMDEVFIVKSGTVTIELSAGKQDLPEGSTVFIPRFTPHGFSNTTDEETVIILIFNPAEQREGYFRGLFELLNAPEMDIKSYIRLSQKYDSHTVDLMPAG